MPPSFAGSLAASFTPFHTDGRLHLERIGPHVEHLVNAGVAGIFAAGTTGEGFSLTHEERRDVAQAFVKEAGERLPVIIHVGHTSLLEARALAEHAQSLGAAGIAAVAPFYYRPATLPDLVASLAEIAAGAPDLPFYYYHIPDFTGVHFHMADLLHAAEGRIPTLAGLKFTSTCVHEFQACVTAHGERYDLFFGRDELLLSSLSIGGQSAVGATYNFAMPIYHAIRRGFGAGDLAEAAKWQSRSVEMVRVLLNYGGLPAFKAAMALVGCDCGPVRLPLRPLDSASQDKLRQDLDSIGFFEWIRPA